MPRRLNEYRVAVVGMMLAASQLSAQAGIPRTSEGRPDMQGIWDFSTLTPLQRPPEFADTPFLTEEQAAGFVERMLAARSDDRPMPIVPVDSRTLSENAINEFWFDRGDSAATVRGRLLSSLVISPPNGRLPALTPEAEQRRLAQERVMRQDEADDVEQRSLTKRCLASHAGPPLMPGQESNLVRIVQTRDYVVLSVERSNDARIVALDGRPRLPAPNVTWHGDPRGTWVGDTLVVETRNLRGVLPIGARTETGTAFELVERLTMVDADTLLYEASIDDAHTFTASWTMIMPMTRSASRMFEYACHEGNYSLANTLRGARAQERHGPDGR